MENHQQHAPHQLSIDPNKQDQPAGKSMSPPPLQLTASEEGTETATPETADKETNAPLSLDDPDFVQQLVDIADYRFLSNRNHALGWHNALYEAPEEEASKGKKKKKEEDPLEGVVEPGMVHPEAAIEPSGPSQAVVDKYCKEVGQRLTDVPFPTKSGTGFKEKGSGHQYMARSHDKNAQAAAHTEWGKTAGLDKVGYDDATDQQETLWAHFKIVLGEEGDTSALNSWDAQIVTIGAGFGAKYGQAGKLLARLPDAYLDQLYQVGIYVGRDGSVRFLDATEKKVYSERDAWKKIKENENLLAYFANLAQSTDMIAEDNKPDEQISMRNAMLRAQWEQFLSNNTKVFGTDLASGPWNTRQMAIKMHHWLPGVYSWKALKDIPKDFDAAFKWGKKKLKDNDLTKYNGQYDRLKRFKDVTSKKKAEEYAERMFNR